MKTATGRRNASYTVSGFTGPRYALLDTLRGLTLCSMIAYHTVWDLVCLFGAVAWPGFPAETRAFVWQQSICWSFIFLSGFCWPLGRAHLRRGLTVFAGGLAVTAVTLLTMYENRVVFGVLTFLGCAMLLLIPLDRLLGRVPPGVGFLASTALFALLRNLGAGYLGFGPWRLCTVPAWLYKGYVATFIGFQDPAFYSSDYFAMLPWLFLFLAGYFACRWLRAGDAMARLPGIFACGVRPLAFLGRHSLPLYLLHQPVIYGVLWLILR